MITNDHDVESVGRVPKEPSAPVGGVTRAGAGGSPGRLRTLVTVCGIVAGLASFAIGEATSELVPPDQVQFDFFGAARQTLTRDSPRVVKRTAALAFGVLGLCLGGCLGIAGGVARRSPSAAATAGLIGATIGLLVGAGGTLWLLPYSMHIRSEYPNNDLVVGILTHGAIWGSLGAVAGLAFAIGLGQPRLIGRACASGFAGALLGAVAFDFIGAFAFPLAKTDSAISLTWSSRLVARLMVSVMTAAVIAMFLTAARPTQAASSGPAMPTIPES